MFQRKKMAEMCWNEIETAFKNDWLVVIPLGAGCKEHGLHLPMNTDLIMAEYLAQTIMSEIDVLIAPTIQDSYFPAFEEYPGSTSLSLETARNLLVEKCVLWFKQGAKQFYVLNTGISTNRPLKEAQEILQKKGIAFEYLDLSSFYLHPDIQKITQQKVGTHADEIETSMMLYIKPDIVHLEKAQAEESPDKPGILTRDTTSTDKTISVTGAWGNPLLATKQKGEIAVNILKEKIKTDLNKIFLSRSQPNTNPGIRRCK